MSKRANISPYRATKRPEFNSIKERRRGDRRISANSLAFPASLMAQMIVDQQQLIDSPSFSRQPVNVPINTYQNSAKATIRRMPAGFSQQEIV